MKLTNPQINKLTEQYNLGNTKNIKIIPGGWVNYNYDIRTSKGSFILRIIGSKIDKSKKSRLDSEFKLLNYLNKKKFPYKVPLPIKNKKGSYLTKILKYHAWVYKKIEGNLIKDYDNQTLKSISKALATYHKYVKNLKITNTRNLATPKKLLEKYKIMKKIKIKTTKDKVMLQNIDIFLGYLNNSNNTNFNINKLPVHYDFHKSNLLFNKKRVVGILDFERTFYAPRILDIAHLIKSSYQSGEEFIKRVNFIIKEYHKTNPLTKKEKELILPILARDNLIMFEKFYNGKRIMKIDTRGAISCLKWTTDVQKSVIRELK